MANLKRFTAMLLCLMLVSVLAVSSAYIAHEMGHDCTGHDCPICQMVSLSGNLLRVLGLAVLLLWAVFSLSGEKYAHMARQGLRIYVSGTPVSLKTRLNN